ncbi:glutamyl-tRNA reductase [Mariprofundus ferrinatatus]|uniref:Glutamyl-tRNA reductase n=1 Tax=Mariprofundus ferrinatatus TaxID=1921087 RepID=A0A2K8L1J2_9PROT|nr:glutamyl-tRNA reductase [Mariprofundus ferrinatatus]ATX81185.1 glutamyl-tRNA reductase [Mariprofundus ferrinatatus]
MRICHIGLNHKTAPVELRERLAVQESDIAEILQQRIKHPAIREAALLSTCNRVEMTVVTHDPDAAIAAVHEWFAEKAQMGMEQVCEHLYSYTTDEAIRHLFCVASGLDSLVLGEPQILGQVKNSYEHALTSATAGHVLHRLYQSTFAAAKRARSETGIGKQAVNISSCAVELARHIFGDLAGKTVLLMGAGEMAELAARHLRGNGCSDILVANRTLERAQNLAMEFEGHALTLDQLPDYLDAADIVLSSTGASTFVLLPETVKTAMKKRRGRPMFLVDIAVPRDIDPRIGDIDGAYLYDIDDLQQVVQGNVEHRQQEAELAREIIEEEAITFLSWLKSLESVPLIRTIQQQMELRRQEEMEKALRYLKDFDDAQIDAVERFSKALMKRYMHPTLQTLKSLPDDIEGDLLMGAAKRLFDLESTSPTLLHTKGKNEQSSG